MDVKSQFISLPVLQQSLQLFHAATSSGSDIVADLTVRQSIASHIHGNHFVNYNVWWWMLRVNSYHCQYYITSVNDLLVKLPWYLSQPLLVELESNLPACWPTVTFFSIDINVNHGPLVEQKYRRDSWRRYVSETIIGCNSMPIRWINTIGVGFRPYHISWYQ